MGDHGDSPPDPTAPADKVGDRGVAEYSLTQLDRIAAVLRQGESSGGDTGPSLEVPALSSSPPSVPRRIGRYQIEKLLGQGGFGLVYLAHDEQLQRRVAVKVPRQLSAPDDVAAYLAEARAAAGLDHPNIVPVYDVGSTEDYPCFIVSKYIDGLPLSERIQSNRPSRVQSVELVATVAEALRYAHRGKLVHRDVKPGNILTDAAGTPFLVDFGMALKEGIGGGGSRYAGTPSYMSPEQARGEGHRVDGRSDIYSLGVVFYELLSGRRPFTGDSQAELLEQVRSFEPRPPRQHDDAIPKELERICMKAMAKRASERYSTAIDLAEDLRHWLGGQDEAAGLRSSAAVTAPPPPAPGPGKDIGRGESGSAASQPAPVSSTLSSQRLHIVPKGLRSFDAHDADFFLELLPGPRDREGLPDSIRFWKTRIEETDADDTFAVGLIYGPSGCGKSSLVKAGLLPRLSDDVIAVYVEATAGETEARLLNGLRKRCPALPADPGLAQTLAALRRGQGVPFGKKVLIVLDQFEQWLHARKDEQNTELVQALRQCDGGRVQCVVMVRDDFWMAATRFMRELEIRLLEGQNSAAVDLFDRDHARKVLAAFGRAFGVLPESPGETPADARQFLSQAVAGLTRESKVISVRLALFADMMKGRPWTPASLKEVGGTEGVGVTFLEETFSAATAPPTHRYHQKAARSVLKSLLPELGSIRGPMRSRADLLEALGYANRPRDFDDLIRVLDGEVRLLTPTDPDGKEAESPSAGAPGVEEDPSPQPSPGVPGEGESRGTRPASKYYQLTHDYLVPALRDWLTRKQKETRRGRAELLLADRAGVWNARPKNRQLPSLREWAVIRLLTRPKTWTRPQRSMMDRAKRHHATRAALTVLLGVALFVGFRNPATPLEQNVAYAARCGVTEHWQSVKPEEVATLEDPDLDDFEVKLDSKVFDLSLWHVAGPQNPELAYLTRVLDLARKPKRPKNRMVRMQFRTQGEGNLPRVRDVILDGRSALSQVVIRAFHAPGTPMKDGRSVSLYELRVDVSRLPEDKTFRVIVDSIFVNGFQSDPEWAGTRLDAVTRKAQLAIKLPKSKTFSGFELYEYPVNQKNAKMVSRVGEFSSDAAGGAFAWTIHSPRKAYVYEIDWTWADR